MPAPNQTLLAGWLARVEDDLIAIENTIRGKFAPNIIAFHAQQASEKLLKLVLLAQGIKPPYIHSLKRLMELLQADFPLRKSMLVLLEFENMHLDSRYPNENFTWQPPSLNDAAQWLDKLQHIRNLVVEQIFDKDSL